jgi:hypothetical protein
MNITKEFPVSTPVLFQGERFRVRKVIGQRDLVIQNVEGYKMTVHYLTVEKV